jgi:hypothetical protein
VHQVAGFTLVHSPLVGPSTWSPVSAELRRRGHHVVVPTLVAAASTGRWYDCVETVAHASSQVGQNHVLVAHSGAGPLLPVIADRLDVPPRRMIFVDASVPPEQGDVPLIPDEFLGQLRDLASHGLLPKWSEWFGPDTMRALIPDTELRDTITAELPQLPLSYFEQTIPMPYGWARRPCAYVLLTEPYRHDAEQARARSWPTIEMSGAHLDIVTRPREITDALLQVLNTT